VDALFSPGAAGEGGRASRREADPPARRFPRTCRLTARRQFIEVYEKGRRMGSTSLVLFGLPNSRGECRLGITVTRKVGGAVARNRIKRIMREIFRRHRATLTPPLDLVVNAKRAFVGKTTDEIEQEFLRTFSRLARRFK
jgi:ribonuclease P protein component